MRALGDRFIAIVLALGLIAASMTGTRADLYGDALLAFTADSFDQTTRAATRWPPLSLPRCSRRVPLSMTLNQNRSSPGLCLAPSLTRSPLLRGPSSESETVASRAYRNGIPRMLQCDCQVRGNIKGPGEVEPPGPLQPFLSLLGVRARAAGRFKRADKANLSRTYGGPLSD
jgi:hypothetical protein